MSTKGTTPYHLPYTSNISCLSLDDGSAIIWLCAVFSLSAASSDKLQSLSIERQSFRSLEAEHESMSSESSNVCTLSGDSVVLQLVHESCDMGEG